MKKFVIKTPNDYADVLEFVSDCNKTQEICNTDVNAFLSAIQFVSECYKTQYVCVKVVDTCPFYLILFLIDISLKKCVIKLLMIFYQH